MRVRVRVKADVCCGYANCVIEQPEVFSLSADGTAVVATAAFDDATPALLDDLTAAAAACPVQAIDVDVSH